MTKDDQIAWLMARVEFLEGELAAERARRPLTPAERQRLKRDREVSRPRHDERDIVSRNSHANVTTSVTAPPTTPHIRVTPEISENLSTEGVQGEGRHVRRDKTVVDEARAMADAAAHGLSEADAKRQLGKFRDYAEKVGWRSRTGPWKDYNAAFRTWLNNLDEYGYQPSGNGSANGSNGWTKAPQSEVDAINERARLLKEQRALEAAG